MRLKSGLPALILVLGSATVAVAAPLPASCGIDTVQYKFKAEKGAPLSAPEAGKAQLVFIQTTEGDFAGMPLSRFAVDGSWIGADKGVSYTVVSVAPGPHKLCASRQSGIRAEKENIGTASVDAQAGKTYYYQFKIKRSEVGAAAQANGGAGQMLNYTPDMTAKRLPTVDTAEFTALSDEEAAVALKHAQHSAAEPK